jgi:hypothetical protein
VLGGRKDARDPGAVGVGRRVVLRPEFLKLIPTLRSCHLPPQDPSPEVVHEALQGLHISLDPGPNLLKGCDLLRRQAQLVLVLQGHVHVLTQPRSQSPEPESTATESSLCRKGFGPSSHGQEEEEC